MTDLEMTRLCAQASGLYEAPYRVAQPHAPHPESALRMAEGRKAAHWYDPLHDDAQAMALVKKFRLTIKCDKRGRWFCTTFTNITFKYECSHANLNHAVVTCVAKMQASRSDGDKQP